MEGKYLTFMLASEGYGLEIRHVTEIIGIQSVTNVPKRLRISIGPRRRPLQLKRYRRR